MEIHPTVHKLFHAHTGAHMMVLICNILEYESIITNVLEETAASIFGGSYLEI
jgi:hypothetical protein